MGSLIFFPIYGIPDFLFPRLNGVCKLPSFLYKNPPISGTDQRPIFKLFWSPGIDSNETIPIAYVVGCAGTTTLFLLGS
jgi:hypothetical protein